MRRHPAAYFYFVCLLTLVALPAKAQLFVNRPDVLVCSVSTAVSSNPESWDKFVFYMSGSRKNGEILYKSLTSNPVLVTINSQGEVSAPNLDDCDGKTVEQLLEAGQAGYFNGK